MLLRLLYISTALAAHVLVVHRQTSFSRAASATAHRAPDLLQPLAVVFTREYRMETELEESLLAAPTPRWPPSIKVPPSQWQEQYR